MKKLKLLGSFLSLFDGEAGTAPTAQGTSSEQGEVNGTVPGNTRRGKSGEFSNVLFGKQPSPPATDDGKADKGVASDAEEQKTRGDVESQNTLKDKRKAYLDLVNSDEFKQIHTEETQRIIDRRFSQTKSLEEKVNKSQSIIDALMLRYNVNDGDLEKLKSAIDNDNLYYSEAAAEAGMDVEQFKEIQRIKIENADLIRREKARLGEKSAQEQLNKWYSEIDKVKENFPEFDINAEVKNDEFMSLLKSGVPMEHAYKVIHMDEIVSAAEQKAAFNTERKVVENVRAKGTRPLENGTQSQSAFTIKDDVSRLSRKERAEIANRVMRGDIIKF